MKPLNFSKYDVKNFFSKNRLLIFCYILFFCLGIVFGTIVVLSSENYISLLTKNRKLVYKIINGTASISGIFFSQLSACFVPMIVCFCFSLNYYVNFLSFPYLAYQSSIFVMGINAVISEFGFSGILNSIFIIIPINLIMFSGLIFWCVVNFSRSKSAFIYKKFMYGFDENSYFWSTILCVILNFAISIFVAFILPIVLKSFIFLLY